MVVLLMVVANPVLAIGDPKSALYGTTQSVCPHHDKARLVSTSPDKWNAASVDVCAASYAVAVEINIYDGDGQLLKHCGQGTVQTYMNFAFCQVAYNLPTGGYAVGTTHWNYPGGSNFFSSDWESAD